MLVSGLLDLILIATVIFSGYLGYRRGFVRSVAKISRIFVAFVLAYLLAPYFSEIFIEPVIYGAVSNRLNAYLIENFADMSSGTILYEDLPIVLRALAGAFNVSLDFSSGADVVSAIVSQLSQPLARVISMPISFALVYFLIKILIRYILRLTDKIFKIKILGIPNKILGCALSSVIGIILAFVITLTFNLIISLPAFSEWALEFEGGAVYNFFNEFTPLELLLSL